MSVLIVGSNGQVGWELVRQATALGIPINACDLPDIDITNPESVGRFIDPDTRLVINAAAYTAVDQAENNRKTAFAVNRDGPANLAAACAGTNIPLIHISTDYVFDGSLDRPYTEGHPVKPLGIYGESKAAGEEAVRQGLQSHLILRTAWLCGVHGNNFVKTMLSLGQEREEISVVDDQHGCPTFAFDLAEAILSLTKQYLDGKGLFWGTYHYCGKGATTWFDFATRIFELAKVRIPLKIKRVHPISSEDYPTPTARPANSVLDCGLIEKRLGITIKPWDESLAVMLERLPEADESFDSSLK